MVFLKYGQGRLNAFLVFSIDKQLAFLFMMALSHTIIAQEIIEIYLV